MSHSKTAAAVTSSNVLSDAKALSEKIATLVGPAADLTKADVQRSAKLRKGGAQVALTIASLSDKIGLVVPSQPTATIVAKVNQAQSLVALHQELVTATKHVADAMFLAQSQAWDGATQHYSMLRRLSRNDGSIGKTLQPVTQFFAARSTAVAQEAKDSRGGARKGTAKAAANRAAKRAADAKVLAASEDQVSTTSDAPAAVTTSASGGVPASPQATTPAPSNGTGH